MIDPKSLQLGNIVRHKLDEVEIYSILTSVVNIIDKNGITKIVDYENIHPIKLTPEILERCGFMKADELNWNLYLDTDTNAEPHTRRHLSWHLNLRELELDMNRLCFMRIKDPSLHTLQNLLNCLNVKIDLK